VWLYSGGDLQPLLASPSDESAPAFSSDGRFLAFESDEAGRPNVYVMPFPGPDARTPVSIDGGSSPRWDRSGRRLFFQSGEKIMVVAVETTPALRVGTPHALLEGAQSWSHGFDAAPGGKRFLMISTASLTRPAELRVILNWFDELERLVPHPRHQ
jgi:eukaryotic-like serine/threonine-protein kinase